MRLFISRSKVIFQAFIRMELDFPPHVFKNTWERWPMNRSVALRALFIFAIVAAFAAITGAASQVEIAEVLFLIGGSLSAVMLLFVLMTPSHNPVPVRVRRRR
ncbi:hypothetical protein VB618_01135 [Microvirga sp. CF3062]|uniref:hypothetical protein n=1 Tax=Microvirga sp. CF3062 TaxID=3110182 RepID=UPI002E76AE6A|nr:hypothetical protein [Microvirga sp. CF3062]MEE1654783.1 hypothetical protein [Microvirga sp. CF3062]